jgi:hypothetical protein
VKNILYNKITRKYRKLCHGTKLASHFVRKAPSKRKKSASLSVKLCVEEFFCRDDVRRMTPKKQTVTTNQTKEESPKKIAV